MVRAEPIRNTYEEFPDELKELLERSKSSKGQVPKSTPTRDALLQDHEWHLCFLREGVLQPRNFILPSPYTPSRSSPSEARKTRIKGLRIESRDLEEVLLLRTLTNPYVYSSSITIVEDEHGDAARLTVCNLEDNMIDPVIAEGQVLAVKQPCWSVASEGGFHIRVDHPSDLVFLDSRSEILPSTWRKALEINGTRTAADWKKEGDVMFLKKRFRTALDRYKVHTSSSGAMANSVQVRTRSFVPQPRVRHGSTY
jgi:hypothetical protein